MSWRSKVSRTGPQLLRDRPRPLLPLGGSEGRGKSRPCRHRRGEVAFELEPTLACAQIGAVHQYHKRCRHRPKSWHSPFTCLCMSYEKQRSSAPARSEPAQNTQALQRPRPRPHFFPGAYSCAGCVCVPQCFWCAAQRAQHSPADPTMLFKPLRAAAAQPVASLCLEFCMGMTPQAACEWRAGSVLTRRRRPGPIGPVRLARGRRAGWGAPPARRPVWRSEW